MIVYRLPGSCNNSRTLLCIAPLCFIVTSVCAVELGVHVWETDGRGLRLVLMLNAVVSALIVHAPVSHFAG